MTLDDTGILYLDGGTTRTRGWAAVGDRVLAMERVSVGARDTAREGSSRRLGEALGHLIRKLGERCRAQGQPGPSLGIAAGMITSPEGLVEVPHVEAPAGAVELARGAVLRDEGHPGSLPIVFVPGIRCGPEQASPEAIGGSDVMRGEEVLGVGLARQGRLGGGGVVLSLGSHWKAVHVDAGGRVTSSVSTLAGEMVHAVRTQTILASSLPRDWPPQLPEEWLSAGLQRGREGGLPRALYCVRLLDQRTPSTPEDRLAFLVGAVIAADEEALLPRATAAPVRVVLAGAPALSAAWSRVIRDRGHEAVTLDEGERESAFRAGCRAVLEEGHLASAGEGRGLAWHPPR